MKNFLNRQDGVAMLMVIAFMGLSIPLITGSLVFASTLGRDSVVKTDILKRQYAGLAIRECVRYRCSQTELPLNGETITFTTVLSTDIEPDACYPQYAGAVVSADIIVHAGEICTLFNTTVEGNVKVEPWGALAVLGSQVDGNVQADGASWMIIDCSGTGCTAGETTATVCSDVFYQDPAGCVVDTVYDPIDITQVVGNIQIDGTIGTPPGGASPNYICNGVDLWGNLQLFNNYAPFEVGGRTTCDTLGYGDSGITIGGDLQAADNEAALYFSDNTISGDLQCSSNIVPATGELYSNTVTGNKTDECEDL